MAMTAGRFDITSGRNGNCRTALCRAATGWDGPTGLGSPKAPCSRPERVKQPWGQPTVSR
jgi:hypothetical protein